VWEGWNNEYKTSVEDLNEKNPFEIPRCRKRGG
jgi:hypothetical protein